MRQQFLDAPSPDRSAELRLTGAHPREVAEQRVDLAVVREQTHGLGEAPLGNRKDIRNAVEAARKATPWAKATAHTRAQVLYYMAENLSLRASEITDRLSRVVGTAQAEKEVRVGIERTPSPEAYQAGQPPAPLVTAVP